MGVDKCKFYTNDGELVFIEGEEDFKKLVEERIGFEAATKFQGLIDAADEIKQRLESDLTNYELDLEAGRSAMLEVSDKVAEIYSMINKRTLDREAIKDKLRHIKRVIDSQW